MNYPEILLLIFSFITGFLYGKRLHSNGLNVDNLFEDTRRKVIFLGVIVIIYASIIITMKFPALFSTDLVIIANKGIWLVIGLLISFLAGITVPLSREKHKAYPVMIVVFCIFAVLLSQKVKDHLFSPIYKEITAEKRGPNGIIFQTTGATCTPASLANILTKMGFKTNEKECARILGTTQYGTAQYELITGLKKFGLEGYYLKATPENLVRLKNYAIISIWFADIRHSIALLGSDSKGNLLTVNPVTGLEKFSPGRLRKVLADDNAVVISSRPVGVIDESSPEFAVREIQAVLKEEKMLQVVSGVYDRETREAVKSFQRTFNLSQSGIVDPQTYLIMTGPLKQGENIK